MVQQKRLVILSHTSDSMIKTKTIMAMGKPQLVVRVPPSLLNDLNGYVETTGISKTDLVVRACLKRGLYLVKG